MKFETDRAMTAGNGILLIGIAWLIFWLGPAYPLFEKDPRWGHNFVIPIIFITVGLAYNSKKISCQLAAVLSSFIVTIPTLLAIWPWNISLLVASGFLVIVIIFYLAEKLRGIEIFNPNPRLKAWLSIHLLNFSYIGIGHMSLIFFVSRWSNPDPFLGNLPVEHDIPTSIFNAMLFILIPFAVMERYVKTLGRFAVSKICFLWSMLMIIIPLLFINAK
ncbi:Uncharacterised protein [uncultured archaeon]|nr:Uncharacterised protein [uncultured archaeon]